MQRVGRERFAKDDVRFHPYRRPETQYRYQRSGEVPEGFYGRLEQFKDIVRDIAKKRYNEREREEEEKKEQRPPVIIDEFQKEPPKPWPSDAPPCPLHPQYGMCIEEIFTKNGPSQLHHCPHEECIVACFGNNEECDFFLECVQRSLHHHYRNPHCPLVCFCGDLILKLSKSEKNTDRLYLRCRKQECNMFQWADTFPHDRVRHHWECYASR